MSITTIGSTRSWTRPNETVGFHMIPGIVTTPVIAAFHAINNAFISSGNTTSTDTYSSDNLTLTNTTIYQDLATFNSRLATFPSVEHNEFKLEVQNFFANTGGNSISGHFIITGIDQPFTVTSTWTFATGTDVSTLLSQLHNTTPFITVTDTSIVAVHQFANCSEYNSLYFLEVIPTISLLVNNNVLKNQVWALV